MRKTQQSGWEEVTLPGAPEAFLLEKPVVVGREIGFASQVPVKVQQDIRQYLGRQNFNCFISLVIPIRRGNFPIGVVNIETNHDKILEASDDTLSELVRVLQPFCALLGLVLETNL